MKTMDGGKTTEGREQRAVISCRLSVEEEASPRKWYGDETQLR
jgi:hypothetical protein